MHCADLWQARMECSALKQRIGVIDRKVLSRHRQTCQSDISFHKIGAPQ